MDPEEFRRQGHVIIDFIADYYKNIEKYLVLSQVQPGYLKKLLPESAPYDPEPIETILQDVQDHIVPGITHWQSPSYFAYFPSSGSIAGFLGEMLSTGFNVVGFNWMSSPAATELESIVMDWLGDMLHLPKSFLFSGNGGGVLQGTTCEAIVCTMAAARDQMLSRIGKDNIGKLVCATMGTTATTSVDPLRGLCDVAKDYDLWVHVDAAYAGSICIYPEFRHFIEGVEGANSFSFNAHKWFLTTLDCCCLWVKNPTALINSLSTNPEYLRNKASDSKQVVDYKDWQIALSRRFRALKLWLVLRSYGVANLRSFIRSHVKMAKIFEGLVRMDNRFEIVVPRNFAVVCFRISPSAIVSDDRSYNGEEYNMVNEINCKLLEAINASGSVFMTHAVVGGVYLLRCAVGATLTEEKHIVEAWKVVQGQAHAILSACVVDLHNRMRYSNI
ncbi:PREDICTED: tyrosine decarboxylase 2-like [Fragaria vesca subsp. vesca]